MKHRTGTLIRRGNTFLVRIVIDGKTVTQSLKNNDGTPCKTRVEARRAQAIAVQCFTLSNRKQALEAAIRQLAETEIELACLQHPKTHIACCWEAYLSNGERPDSGEGCLSNYRTHTKQFQAWAKKHYPKTVYLQDVSKAMVTEYSLHLAETFSAVTHNKNIVFLRLLFKVLCEGKPNPFDRIKLKPKDTTPHEALTPEQLQAILGKAEGEFQTFLLVGIYTALRRQDVALLQWESIDLDKGVITVTPRKTASRSRKTVAIPIHPMLKERLLTLFKTSEYVMPRMAFWYQHNPAHISRRVKDLFEACGINTQKEVEGKANSKRHNKALFSFHSLRMTMGQQLISNGYTLDCIAQVLGHSSIAMSRHYSTITDTVKEKAILSLPSIATA